MSFIRALPLCFEIEHLQENAVEEAPKLIALAP